MSTRMILTAAAVVVLLLAVAGISMADARSDDPDVPGTDAGVTDVASASESARPETPTASASASPGTSTVPADGTTYEAGEAGTVTVVEEGGVLSITGTTAADGWVADIDDPQGREVEVDFTDGAREIEFDAQLEDGQIRIRVRDEVDDDDDRDDRDDRDDDDPDDARDDRDDDRDDRDDLDNARDDHDDGRDDRDDDRDDRDDARDDD